MASFWIYHTAFSCYLGDFMILSLVIFFPLLAGIFGFFIDEKNIKIYGTLAAFIELCLVLFIWISFGSNGYEFVEASPLIPSIGISYFLGVDGISLVLILMSAFMTLVGLISVNITHKIKHLIISILFLEMTMMGVFLSLDAIMFYAFWELSLIPMLYIIGVWGSGDKIYAAVKFFLYTFFGSVLMLVGIVTMAYINFKHTGDMSFNILQWQTLPLGINIQIPLFFAFGIAFAIKTPLFPFHTWLPYAHGQAPTIGSILLAAVLLKMGTYGFVRFLLPMFPDASVALSGMMGVIGCIMVIYASFVAFAQKDIKQVIAYSSIAHMGIIVLGVFSFSVEGISGAVFFMVSHGIVSGGLFMLIGFIYDRAHTKDMSEFGGIAKVMPIYATLFCVVMLGGIGLPLTSGFVGEFLSLLGIFKVSPWQAFFGGLGIIMGAIYSMNLYKRVFFGELNLEKNGTLKDLNKKELCAILPIVFLVLYLGIFPNTALKHINKATINTIGIMQQKALDESSLNFIKNLNQIRSSDVK